MSVCVCVCGAIARDSISVVSVILYGHKWPAADCCCLLSAASVAVAVVVVVVVAVTPKNPVPVYPQQAACADVVVVVVVAVVVVVVVVIAVFVAGPIASRLRQLLMLQHKPHTSINIDARSVKSHNNIKLTANISTAQ